VPELPTDRWFVTVLGAERIVVGNEELDGLLLKLTTDSEEGREAAALALGSFEEAAIEPLAAILASGETSDRWWAARALAEVGSAGAVSPLAGALSDSDPDVRACAALALGRIADGSAALALASRLADGSAFVASIAADALAMIGEAAVEALTQTLTEENPHVRLLAVRALSRINAESAIAALFSALEDPSYLVSTYAREALDARGVGLVFLRP
jgi:HEAT repeat protein